MQRLFDTSDFPARWSCGNWSSLHGWTHVVADVATAGAYFTIPLVIVAFIRRKPDAQFPALFWLFAAFILSCGTVHLIESTLFWQPWYRLSALFKVLTAAASWIAVVALIRVFPEAMRLPALPAVNARLEAENAQRRAAEEELLRSNEELQRFAYAASHDLRAPLRAISNLAEWVEEDSKGALTPESKGHLDTLRARVRRLDRLMNDLLQYSRAGHDTTEVEDIDVTELAHEIAEMAAPPEGFEVRVEGELPHLRARRTRVQQVLLNLVSNAVKHHDLRQGVVRIAGRVHDGEVELSVEDDGPGIPPEHHERVFQMFQTLRPRDEVEGSGMGLALVKKIVEGAGGRVEVVSPAERGTRFVVHWPQPAAKPAA